MFDQPDQPILDPTLDDASVLRHVTVTPSMCGHNSLLVGRIGDWTWQAVARSCGIDVLNARTPSGDRTYLVFHYYRLRGSAEMYPLKLTFGDALHVRSQVFDFGRQSVLTLHRIAPAGSSAAADSRPLDPQELYDDPRPDCLYAENFNRWLCRSDSGDIGLTSSSPDGLRHHHLPKLPDRYSPRAICRTARRTGTLAEGLLQQRQLITDTFTMPYRIDLTRDINGIGLIHFASYFSFIDTALLACWRRLGRSDTSFLSRRVTDQKLCYVGNADADSTLTISLRVYGHLDDPLDELIDVAIREQGTNRLLAVSALHLLREAQ